MTGQPARFEIGHLSAYRLPSVLPTEITSSTTTGEDRNVPIVKMRPNDTGRSS
jgi:hypothetical protein